jgi:hypothetical protein
MKNVTLCPHVMPHELSNDFRLNLVLEIYKTLLGDFTFGSYQTCITTNLYEVHIETIIFHVRYS